MHKTLIQRITLSAEESIQPKKRDLIMRKLRERFEGVCFSGVLIQECLEITQIGDRVSSKDTGTGTFYCDVEFKVRCMQFVNNLDVIVDAKLISKNGTISKFENATCVCIVDDVNVSKFLQPGDAFPILVVDASYPIFHKKINITGKFYRAIPQTLVYEITEESENKEIKPEIVEEMTKLHIWFESGLDKDIFSMFDTYLYPYKQVVWEYDKKH